ncbi:MAG: hypothetical protein R3F14_23265 [Polyangiaceae bacterium]
MARCARRAARARAEAGGSEARTLKLSIALREPVSGRRMEARGAVALAPEERAVRMILVGPGGTTAFDLWIRADQFRVAIPAIDILRRGDGSTPRTEMRGLPVDFLQWWLLGPTRGDLLWASSPDAVARAEGAMPDAEARIGGAGRARAGEGAHLDSGAGPSRFVLRDGAAITELFFRPDGSIEARRQTWAAGGLAGSSARVLVDEESVVADRFGCGHARYTQASTGVELEITCEGIEPNAPSPRAFVDPDAPEEEDP